MQLTRPLISFLSLVNPYAAFSSAACCDFVVLYYSCPESGQKFKTYEDLMRYVNYAKAAELSIYSPDFRPRNPPRRQKKKASTPESDETEKSTDSEDSTFKLPAITSLDFLDVTSPTMSYKQSDSWKEKLEKSRGSDEGCSSSMGKAKKQKI